MSRFLTGLNPEQCKAVRTTEGPLLVLAGAGTGKTRVITHRIAYMISKGVSPKSILAMTFTNKAAGEMKARITKLVPKVSSGDLTVGTFHSFCVKALRQFPKEAGVRKNFAICDAADQLVAMKSALRDLRIPETTIQPKVCLGRVSLLKSQSVEAEELIKSDDDWEHNIGKAYARYDERLRTSGLLDFDDLLLYMVKLLDNKKICGLFRKRYQYLFIDEYQDTNGPQYQIVKKIGEKHRNVCVVGDDDQSIYGWRGADVTKILNFEDDFPKATVVRLETNYRSTEEILCGANLLISNNTSRHDKCLNSAVGCGEQIRITRFEDEETEARCVVEDIMQRAYKKNAPINDFAILFRTQVQPRLFEMQLRQNDIPYTLVGGMSFFDRKEVRDVLAFLKLVDNPSDELSLLRVINVPARGIGATTIKKALAIATKESSSLSDVLLKGTEFPELNPSAVASACELLSMLKGLRKLRSGPKLVQLVKKMLVEVNYGEEIIRCYPDEQTRTVRWEALNEIMNMAEIHARRKKDATLATFLEDLVLSATDEDDADDSKNGGVMLMTLHSAKGLEFEQVYLVGFEEGLLPHMRSVQEGTVEEERRLAYVGVTRAKRRLMLTYTASRSKYSQRVGSIASRFLYEILGKERPENHIEAVARMGNISAPKEKKPKKKKAAKKKGTKKKSSNHG
jgi:DNA helicase-2/ATP-dependent DNA helicase PcrA